MKFALVCLAAAAAVASGAFGAAADDADAFEASLLKTLKSRKDALKIDDLDTLALVVKKAVAVRDAAHVKANGGGDLTARSLHDDLHHPATRYFGSSAALADVVGCQPLEGDASSIECCVEIAKLSSAVCAVANYEESDHSIDIAVTVAGFPVWHKTFNKLQTYYCGKFFGRGTVCGNLTNESFGAGGACGCLVATVSLGGLDIPLKVGCYAFGHECMATNCADYKGCKQCTILRSCGNCGATDTCTQGSAEGPAWGSCNSGWAFSKDSC